MSFQKHGCIVVAIELWGRIHFKKKLTFLFIAKHSWCCYHGKQAVFIDALLSLYESIAWIQNALFGVSSTHKLQKLIYPNCSSSVDQLIMFSLSICSFIQMEVLGKSVLMCNRNCKWSFQGQLRTVSLHVITVPLHAWVKLCDADGPLLWSHSWLL